MNFQLCCFANTCNFMKKQTSVLHCLLFPKKIFFAEKGSPTVVLSTVLGKAAGFFCGPVLSFAA